jgi:hypothetical protein
MTIAGGIAPILISAALGIVFLLYALWGLKTGKLSARGTAYRTKNKYRFWAMFILLLFLASFFIALSIWALLVTHLL